MVSHEPPWTAPPPWPSDPSPSALCSDSRNVGLLQGLQDLGRKDKHPDDSALLSSLSFEGGKIISEKVASEKALEKDGASYSS